MAAGRAACSFLQFLVGAVLLHLQDKEAFGRAEVAVDMLPVTGSKSYSICH